MIAPPSNCGSRILLGQLFSNGDCLFATAIARQIKEDYPGCHLTWAISKGCRSILLNNPHVDEVWQIDPPLMGELREQNGWEQSLEMWRRFKKEAINKKAQGDFDEIFLTQIGSRNFHRFDGTVRSTIYSNYPGRISTIAPVLRLTADEVDNVRRFVADHPALTERAHRVLFECSPKSGQALLTPEIALGIARTVLVQIPDACFVLSSNLAIATGDKRIIDGSKLGFRENAELTKYCTLLIGCSSGISWLCTSDWAKPLPTIQMLSNRAPIPNSMALDHRRWNLPTDHIIELIDGSADELVACLLTVFQSGVPAIKARFHQEVSLVNSYNAVQGELLRKGLYCRTFYFLFYNFWRDGVRLRLILGAARAFYRHFRGIGRRWMAKGCVTR